MDTSETGLEKIIVDWLVQHNGYEQEKPIPIGTGGGKPKPEMDLLSNIIKDFHELYGLGLEHPEEAQSQIKELPDRISSNIDFANAVRNGDKQVAQIIFNDIIVKTVAAMLEEKTEFVQLFFSNQDFMNLVNARVFQAAVSQLLSQRL